MEPTSRKTMQIGMRLQLSFMFINSFFAIRIVDIFVSISYADKVSFLAKNLVVPFVGVAT